MYCIRYILFGTARLAEPESGGDWVDLATMLLLSGSEIPQLLGQLKLQPLSCSRHLHPGRATPSASGIPH
jgi:hypothetical protein